MKLGVLPPTLRPRATLLALGGASWPKLGSDGLWTSALSEHGIEMIDCQQVTAHLASLGARPLPRAQFLAHLELAVAQPQVDDKT